MSFHDDLDRIDRVSLSRGERLPTPASSEEIEVLRAAVAPMEVPSEVIALYEWHNGAQLGFLNGYGFRPIEGTIEDRWFSDPELDAPPAMLFLSTPPGGSGQRIGATLDVPGLPQLPGLWTFETHDHFAYRTHDRISDAVKLYADLLDELPLSVGPQQLMAGRLRRIPGETDLYMLKGGTDPIHWIDAPTGVEFPRFQDDGWPAQWTASLQYR